MAYAWPGLPADKQQGPITEPQFLIWETVTMAASPLGVGEDTGEMPSMVLGS